MSVHRWDLAMERHGGTGEAMLWRLLRMGSAPYFVLGSSATRSLRLRIATPWDWRQHFSLGAVFMTEQRGGQPRVGWEAVVRDRATARGARAGRAHRGAVEPWPLRRAARSKGVPGHPASSRPRVLRAAVTPVAPLPSGDGFDPAAVAPPLHVPEISAGPVVLRPFRMSDLDLVRRGRRGSRHRRRLVGAPRRQRHRGARLHRTPAPARRTGRRLLVRPRLAPPSRGEASGPSGCGSAR